MILGTQEVSAEQALPLEDEGLGVQCVGDVALGKVEWLWPERVAVGKLTLFLGEAGVGKSVLAAELAARVTRGAEWPQGWFEEGVRAPQGSVLFLTEEGSLRDTLGPRLAAAGADLKQVFVMEGVKVRGGGGKGGIGGEGRRALDLGTDLALIERAIVAAGNCKLLVIDPLRAVVGERRAKEALAVDERWRRLLAMAARYGVAVVAFAEKSRSKHFQACAAAARATWQICRVPTKPQARHLVPVANCLSERRDVFAYDLETAPHERVPRMRWAKQPVTRNPDEVLAEERAYRRTAADRFEAETILRMHLQSGPMASKLILELAAELGVPAKTIRLVYRLAGGNPEKLGMRGGWVWDWPSKWERVADGGGNYPSPPAPLPQGERGAKKDATRESGEKSQETSGNCEDGSVGGAGLEQGDVGGIFSSVGAGQGVGEGRHSQVETICVGVG